MSREEPPFGIKGLVLRGGPLGGGGVSGGMYVGDWKIFSPKIDYERCTKCWLCVTYCPEAALSKGERGPELDPRFCKGCGICGNECPVEAIEMVRE
ncbi:MAG: pyruvate ferredoxin oxidoreductase [Candidatus Bathyarchaeota archaeon B23]|nr:MAG: pyruvate ferredoxin oxidoreductase [Candidatus Bathyarchaeota archaeon B23]